MLLLFRELWRESGRDTLLLLGWRRCWHRCCCFGARRWTRYGGVCLHHIHVLLLLLLTRVLLLLHAA